MVSVQKESHALGGAGNVIHNLVAMGAEVVAIGTAGTGKAGQMIFEKLERLLITCGKDGMVLFEKGKEPCSIESRARQVFDVSGAGDTVISLLGLGLAVGATFNQSASIANAAAGIVVAKVGTATASIDELKQALAD